MNFSIGCRNFLSTQKERIQEFKAVLEVTFGKQYTVASINEYVLCTDRECRITFQCNVIVRKQKTLCYNACVCCVLDITAVDQIINPNAKFNVKKIHLLQSLNQIFYTWLLVIFTDESYLSCSNFRCLKIFARCSQNCGLPTGCTFYRHWSELITAKYLILVIKKWKI